MHELAQAGGKKAVAAPRSRGKSTIVKGMHIYLAAACLAPFIVAVGATSSLAKRLFSDFRTEWKINDLLFADFPEICAPVRELDGAPQRAARQHVDGHLTNINWPSDDFLRLPRVPGYANDYLKSLGAEWSPYAGYKMTYAGLDAAFRGLNIDDDRPTFLSIDDPETRESANSLTQIESRIEIIERDIEGLEGGDRPMGIMMITTVQKAFSASAQYTDPLQKPAWGGERYGWVQKWPDRMDLWDEYIALRHKAQKDGDRYGMVAVEFYLANRDAMHEGAELIAENYKPVKLPDGRDAVHSALHEAFNKIADTNMAAFRSEYQNDPEPEEEAEGLALTPGRVAGQLSGLQRGETPDDTFAFMGIDIGKYKSHWVKIACTRDAVVWITDYGIVETSGLSKYSTDQAIELQIVHSLMEFSESEECTENPPVLVLVDSGDFTESVYEFSRQAGAPFFASKGWDAGRFRLKKESDDYQNFLEAYAHRAMDSKQRELWLYHVNTEYWKNWGQQRFLVDAFMDATRLPGSVALFEPPHGDVKYHLQFARHMVSESEQFVPVDGKVNKRVWVVHDKKNNHWLDAYALACAAAGCAGIRLVDSEPPSPTVPPRPTRKRQVMLTPTGQPFFIGDRT